MNGTAEGRKRGGVTTTSRYAEIFAKGRALANERARETEDALLCTPLTPELGELVGAFIGDRFSNKLLRTGITEFSGHSTLDFYYMDTYLISLLRTLDIRSKIQTKKVPNENTLRLRIYSKALFLLFTHRFRMPAGKKCYTVTIPEEILHAEQNIINACIRGIFDTDGCVAFDNRKIYREPYIRIILISSSPVLLVQVREILVTLGIKALIAKRRLQINGFKNCKQFIEEIGFSNSRHLAKIQNLKR
jgi:intein/homing endonuclease